MKIKLILFLVFIIFFILSCSESTAPLEETQDKHFDFILYNGLSTTNIADISEALENNYGRIINDLQVQSMPVITIKIWADYTNFLDAMENDIGTRYNGATGYILGMSEFRLFYTNDVALAAVHEFAHVVSMHVNSSIPNNPRWLWEAVALYESNDFINPGTLSYMVSGDYPTLDELNTDYNSSNHYIYSVGYVLLEYIVETWGMDTVIDLIKNNGNIPNLLGISVQEFEAGWFTFVEVKYLNI